MPLGKTLQWTLRRTQNLFTLNHEVWAKAVTDAIKNGNDPAIVVVLGEGNKKIRLAIIELELLEQMVNNGTE